MGLTNTDLRFGFPANLGFEFRLDVCLGGRGPPSGGSEVRLEKWAGVPRGKIHTEALLATVA